jgi:hypothetical protein
MSPKKIWLRWIMGDGNNPHQVAKGDLPKNAMLANCPIGTQEHRLRCSQEIRNTKEHCNMKSVIASLFVLIIWISNVWAEGAWNVNGYAFTNVHAWQNGKEVKVSGRVSNGPVRSPLQAEIHLENDAGKTRKVKIKIDKFTGQGEIFETRFTDSKRATWWRVTRIDVAGNEPDQIKSKAPKPQTTNSPSRVPHTITTSPSSYPVKYKNSGAMSNVLFVSMRAVCVTVRDKNSNSLVLMKNVSPEVLEKIQMQYGAYTATIIGDGIKCRKNSKLRAKMKSFNLTDQIFA